jgi:stress-induced morphogen
LWLHLSGFRNGFAAPADGVLYHAPMPTAAHVRAAIESALPGARVEVVDTTGTEDHFAAEVVAEQFAGLSRIDQHRMVYAALADGMADGSIHALALRTRAPQAATTETRGPHA